MLKFGLKNMRRLEDVPLIPIKPITILVGRNSSGKSTFLRTFPLIRQSINTRTSSPILWYGDLVDFGEFASVITGRDLEKCITLSFGVDEFTLSPLMYHTFFRPMPTKIRTAVDVDIIMSGDSGKAKIEAIRVVLPASQKEFLIELDDIGGLKNLYFNGQDVTSLFETLTITFAADALFPEISIKTKDRQPVPSFQWYSAHFYWGTQVFVRAIKPHINSQIKEDKIVNFASSFFEMKEFSAAELLKLEKKIKQQSVRQLISHIRTRESSLRDRVHALYEAWKMFEILPAVFSDLRSVLSKTLYIGPMRARSERYYRYQDLAVAEIDPDGKNFPMFLNSLTLQQRLDFSEWVHKQFGYGVEVKSESGHISINLTFGSDTSNIVDNGYGISQVLPVLGQIWWAAYQYSMKSFPPPKPTQTTIVIEQPELHLHPAHQSLLADAIMSTRSEEDQSQASNITFVVETHSEAIVNRLGQLIADGRVPNSDVQVLVFEDDPKRALTDVRIATFDKLGALENWPFGFFQPEDH